MTRVTTGDLEFAADILQRIREGIDSDEDADRIDRVVAWIHASISRRIK